MMDLPGAPPVIGEVSNFAGTGVAGFDDDPAAGLAGTATFSSPVSLSLDENGSLVGVVKGRYRGSDAIGFLIPIETVIEFLNNI